MTRRSSLLEIRRHCITMLVVMSVMVSIFVSVNFIDKAEAHIDEGIGDPLQLYSYFDSDASTAIILDGEIARGGSAADEWDGGYAREINITNGVDYKFCYILFANDDNYLYVGVIYDSPSANNANGIQLYFDEGIEAGRYDGSHNDQLDFGKENMIECRGNGSPTRQYHDYYYNDTGEWVPDNTSDTDAKESWDDFDFDIGKGGNYFNWEVMIPLDPKEDTPGEESDLNIAGIDELGFYIRIWDANDGTWYYWDLTGPDPSDANNYADLRLGIEVKKDITIYATFANTGSPTIDGDLSGDFAWANSYERSMTLTNFRGETIMATLYACEDPSTGYIFIGMVIYDNETTSGDYLRLYFEEGSGGGPYGPRNGILSTLNEDEHFQQVYADGTYNDGLFDPSGSGEWKADDYNGPNNPDNADDGNADMNYKNEIGTINDRYEFEFLVPYTPGTSELLDGDQDLWITSSDLVGFLIRFHDESQVVGEQDFWWDFTTNLDSILTQETASGVFSAIGWAYLQTGAPALKPITPIDGGTVFGSSYIFRVEAEDENGFGGVNFVGFQVEGETSWISLTRESNTSGIWYTYWDTTAFPDGVYNVTIAAQDDDGITVKKIITVIIANGGAAAVPPTITLTSPAKGSTISGTVEFQATTGGLVTAVEFYVDNQLIATMSNISIDAWQYFLDTTYWSDTTHIVSVIARNAAGEGADAGTYIFDNWNLISLNIIQPASGSPVSGTISVIGNFLAGDSGDYAELYVDGDFWDSDNSIINSVTFDLDTTILSEGSHQIKMYVYDPDGFKVMDMVNIVVDNLPPGTPTVASVLNGQNIEGVFTFQVQGGGADLEGIDLTIINEDTSTEIISNITMGYNSGSGYFEFTLDTGAVQGGNYTVLAYAVDLAGNAVSSNPVDFNIDNNAPNLMITSPMDNSVVSGSVNFVYVADDPFLKDVMYKIDGNSWADIGTAWDTSNFNDGAHTVKIRVRDNSGHEIIETLTLIVDNSNPTISIINPLSSQFIEGTFTFKIMADDEVGVDEVRITINNTDIPSTIINDIAIGYNSATGYYEYSLDTNAILDGNYSILTSSYDVSGFSSGMTTVNFQVDNTPPDITIIHPQNNAFVSDDLTFYVMMEDVFHLDTMYNIDGTGWVDVNEMWDTGAVEDGDHTVQIRARDEADHETIEQIILRVDNNVPSIGINSPVSEQFLEGTHTFQIVSNDDVGVDEVRIIITNTDSSTVLINDIPIGFNSATGYYEYTLDTSAFEDGNYSLSCTSKDLSGQSSGTATVNFNIDNNPPLLTIRSPLEGDLLTGSVSIDATVEDLFLSTLAYRVDGSGWIDTSVSWDTSGVEDGAHRLEIKAEDEIGNVVMQAIEVNTDNNGPELYAVSLPKENEHVSSFFVQVEVEDIMGIDSVGYEFDDTDSVRMFLNISTGFYEAGVITDSTGLYISDGEHQMNITAIDVAGHETVMTRNLFIDNTGPQITIKKPSATFNLNDDVEFVVETRDDTGVEKVYIRIDKGKWMEMQKSAENKYIYHWNSRKVYNGRYDVDVNAGDSLGNENMVSTDVNVDNFPWLGLTLFVVGLIVLLILAMFNWPKGKKPEFPIKEEEAPKEPKEEKIEEEELPPPPEKATIVELPEEEEAPQETEEVTSELEEEAPPPKGEPPEEEYEEDMDKLAPPAPEETYEDEY